MAWSWNDCYSPSSLQAKGRRQRKHAYVIPLSSSTERGVLDLFTGLLLAGGPCCLAAFPGASSESWGICTGRYWTPYQVAENLRGFSVLSRILEEGSANSYWRSNQRDLSRSLPVRTLGKSWGWLFIALYLKQCASCLMTASGGDKKAPDSCLYRSPSLGLAILGSSLHRIMI